MIMVISLLHSSHACIDTAMSSDQSKTQCMCDYVGAFFSSLLAAEDNITKRRGCSDDECLVIPRRHRDYVYPQQNLDLSLTYVHQPRHSCVNPVGLSAASAHFHSFASAIPPPVMENVASLSGMSGLKGRRGTFK